MQSINDDTEIFAIIDSLKTDRIRCMKYNSAFDLSTLRESTFQSYLQLSQDGQRIIITNKKFIKTGDYILEADPNEIEKQQKKVMASQLKKMRTFRPSASVRECDDDECDRAELQDSEDRADY